MTADARELEEHNFRALGTDIQISIICQENEVSLARDVLTRTEKECLRLQKIFSRFDPESEVSWLNRNLGEQHRVSPELGDVIKRSLQAHKETKSMFDPRILTVLEGYGYREDFYATDFSVIIPSDPMVSFTTPLSVDLEIQGERARFRQRMDFSGIAKGYIVDRLVLFLQQDGWRNFLVDAGGDLFAAGKNATGNAWRISIEGIPTEAVLIPLNDQALATSGVTRRKWMSSGRSFHHLISPRDPTRFDYSISTVTVLAPTTTQAEILAKEYFFLGSAAGLIQADARRLGVAYLFPDGSFSLSQYFQETLQ